MPHVESSSTDRASRYAAHARGTAMTAGTPLLLSLVALLLLGADRVDVVVVARDELEGAWKLVSVAVGDEVMQAETGADLDVRISIRDGVMFVDSSDDVTRSYRLNRDPRKRPAEIGWSDDGKTCRGIYEVEGDVLRLCCTEGENAPRPTTFEPKNLEDGFLFVLHRVRR